MDELVQEAVEEWLQSVRTKVPNIAASTNVALPCRLSRLASAPSIRPNKAVTGKSPEQGAARYARWSPRARRAVSASQQPWPPKPRPDRTDDAAVRERHNPSAQAGPARWRSARRYGTAWRSRLQRGQHGARRSESSRSASAVAPDGTNTATAYVTNVFGDEEPLSQMVHPPSCPAAKTSRQEAALHTRRRGSS